MTDPMTSASPLALVLRLEKALTRGLTVLLTALFAIIFVLVTTLVVMRYGFNRAIIGGSEASVALFIYTTALGASVDIARGKHIRIDSLIAILPERIRNWIEILNLGLIGTLHAFLFVYSIKWISVVGNSKDPVMHTPDALVEIAIPIGCAFAVVFCITRIAAMVLAAPTKTA